MNKRSWIRGALLLVPVALLLAAMETPVPAPDVVAASMPTSQEEPESFPDLVLDPPEQVEPLPVEPEPEPEPAPDPEPVHFTLVVTGDLMVHQEQLNDALARGAGDGQYDFSHVFAQVAEDLREGDYTMGNLETVFAGGEDGYSDYPQFNTPDSFGQALKESGFHFVTTANNHAMDQGEKGLLRTLTVLDELGLDHTGTFASKKERDTILMVEVKGVSIALLSYTFGTNGIPLPKGKEYLVNPIEQELIVGDIKRARELGAELVIVLPHMGNEYELTSKDAFQQWMNLMMKNGADLVLASHPHVLQSMAVKEYPDGEGTRTAFVIHSLGNFVSSQRYEPRECSIILKLDFVREPGERPVLERVRFVPTWVQFRDVGGKQLVRVVPILDAIRDYEGENTLSIHEGGYLRMKQAHNWITKLYLGSSPAGENMQREYVFYQR